MTTRSQGLASGEPPAPRNSSDRHALHAIAITVAVAALVMSTIAIVSNASHSIKAASKQPPTAPLVPNGTTKTVQITEGDMYVHPSSLSVEFGTKVILKVVNRGPAKHDLQIEGGAQGTGLLTAGQQKSVDLGVLYRSTQAWCTVPGHKAAGMNLSINVTNGLGESSSTNPVDARINFAATAPDGFHSFSPYLENGTAARVHNVTIVAQDKEMEVAPGVTQDMWTFNGQVPGPTLQGHVGDVFNITFANRTNMDHSLDFHAFGQPLPDMASAPPGKTVTERLVATHSGIFLYHCGTAPVIEHLANGMFGAVIISPQNLAPVSQQLLLIQSELYLGAQRGSGDYTKMISGKPDAVVFNEYANQYTHDPIKITAGKKVRIWVLDAGPSKDTSFHVVGAIFDTVFKEGSYRLEQSSPANGGSQVLDLMPGQGGFVELTLSQPGRYEFLDHHLDHAALGAAGFLISTLPPQKT